MNRESVIVDLAKELSQSDLRVDDIVDRFKSKFGPEDSPAAEASSVKVNANG
jgi:hypothetical protein